MEKQKAIGILGVHRSGTSAISRALNLLGVYIGEPEKLSPPMGDFNPTGFWEHKDIVEIQQKILDELSSKWDTTVPLPDGWWEFSEIAQYKKELIELIKNEFIDKPLWGWKDPRTCILLPLWNTIMKKLDIDVSYVIALRNPLDVAASLERRDGFSRSKSFGIWSVYLLSALHWSQGFKRVFLHYDKLLLHPEAYMKQIASLLEIPWIANNDFKKAISSSIKKTFRHSRSPIKDLFKDNQIPKTVISLYKLCLKAEKNHTFSHSNDFSNKVNKSFNDYSEYAGMVSKEHRDRFKFQVFLPPTEQRPEVKSVNFNCDTDGKVHEFDLILPASDFAHLLIDIYNFPAYVEIQSIKLLSAENSEIIFECSKNNNFKGLSAGSNTLLLNKNNVFTFFTTGNDAQLFLTGIQSSANPQALKIQVALTVDTQISNRLIKMYAVQSEKLNHKDEQISKFEAMIQDRNILVSTDLRKDINAK